MSEPAVPRSLSRPEFRALVDPVLLALGFTAEQVITCMQPLPAPEATPPCCTPASPHPAV